MLLLLVLGIKSCRDTARKDSFKSYVRDQAAIVQASGQESKALFALFTNPGRQSAVQLQNAVNGYENDASQLVDRAKSIGIRTSSPPRSATSWTCSPCAATASG